MSMESDSLAARSLEPERGNVSNLTPELGHGDASIRVPELRNVPLTARLQRIVDHPDFQRLRSVRQLGPTHLVYPGAVHTRFEHSLGVFDLGRQYLQSLLRHESVRDRLRREDIEVCLLGCLLHDLGHYPFAHSLEALHHKGRDTPRHEDLAGRILCGEMSRFPDEPCIGELIESEFDLDPAEVAAFISTKPHAHQRAERRLVASILSSGVDADKADYLERDSLHMGVSYGRNYDRARFLASLCPNPTGDRIAVSPKGKVSCEIFVFCRYTMFSEAYWHHTVRAVSAMMERALADMQEREDPLPDALADELLQRDDDAMVRWLLERAPRGSVTDRLLSALAGGRRHPHKRVLTLSRVFSDARYHDAYERIYHLDREGFSRLERILVKEISGLAGTPVEPGELILDTPPRDKDRIETVEVVYASPRGGRASYQLEEQSKVVQGIANDFIKVVKKIRIFVAPRVRDALDARHGNERVREHLVETILAFDPDPSSQQRLVLG